MHLVCCPAEQCGYAGRCSSNCLLLTPDVSGGGSSACVRALGCWGGLSREQNQDAVADGSSCKLETFITPDQQLGALCAEDEAEGAVERRPAKKARKMVLRQVIAQQALQQGPMVESDEEGKQQEPVISMTYEQEQATLKNSFLEVRAGALPAPVTRLQSLFVCACTITQGLWGSSSSVLHEIPRNQQLLLGVRQQEPMMTKEFVRTRPHRAVCC